MKTLGAGMKTLKAKLVKAGFKVEALGNDWKQIKETESPYTDGWRNEGIKKGSRHFHGTVLKKGGKWFWFLDEQVGKDSKSMGKGDSVSKDGAVKEVEKAVKEIK